eukprot:1398723-Rhodomonas_salina.2
MSVNMKQFSDTSVMDDNTASRETGRSLYSTPSRSRPLYSMPTPQRNPGKLSDQPTRALS